MVLVQLRLSNFMSYGTSAPVLDFTLFHVACLSGKNGQGKSALLDAVTWALWGEARKASGVQKPDENLLRIGTRDMEVELVFDVEGERYRVIRKYILSTSGRSSRPSFELNVFDPESGMYRPLTGPSIRETQQILNNIVGIDYHTFINSAFLLQGRSDEFTNKKPSERKEILARILNLKRYEELADMSRRREREARDRIDSVDHIIGRLKSALKQVPEVEGEYLDVNKEIEEKQKHLIQLREEGKDLAERMAEIVALSRDAVAVEDALESIDQRCAHYRNDIVSVQRRLTEAESLVAQKDVIEKDYDHYQALLKEREKLDIRRDLHHGIEKQIEQRERALHNKSMQLEKQHHRLEIELRTQKERLYEHEARLAEAPAIRRRLEKALQANTALGLLNATRNQRNQIEDECTRIERRLHGRREALKGELKTIEEQMAIHCQSLSSIHELRTRYTQVEASIITLSQLQVELEEKRKKGQALTEALREHQGKSIALEQELKNRKAAYKLFISSETGPCPTCGTPLSENRHLEVSSELEEKVNEITSSIAHISTLIKTNEKEHESLRLSYRGVQQQIEELSSATGELVQLKEQLHVANKTESTLVKLRERANTIITELDTEAHDPIERKRFEELKTTLKELPFDEKAFEETREEAVKVRLFEDRLSEMDLLEKKINETQSLIEIQSGQVEESLKRFDSDPGITELQFRLIDLKQQLAGIEFDPVRFADVRNALSELEQAGARMKDLLHAQQNQVEWKQQLATTDKRMERLLREKHELQQKLETIKLRLQERSSIEKAQVQYESRAKRFEEDILSLQKTHGVLSARLEQARLDREALKEYRKQQAEARTDRTLYGHLKTAFGRNGIPSLIIESALPEIEERTNILLDQLTEGRMNVRLETLKDKKTGGTKETLEIIITDDQGIARPYETYSGGEAFRINFSLRIALAQLLADRSGVRIRTLVVDEGFGTQDSQGIQNLVEAIQAIQNDFDKIIVITHLDQIKDIFPVRIEVEKDPVEGSYFEMIGV